MALTDAYTLASGRIAALFQKIRDGQAPEQFTTQLLKDWGFSSSNDRAALPILKALGFLTADGKPTNLYHEYRDHSKSKAVMAQALRTAYSDIFLIKERPTESDKTSIQGKFKSFHNQSDKVASLMTSTFFALLKLADLDAPQTRGLKSTSPKDETSESASINAERSGGKRVADEGFGGSLHYNIQIHLPATKDIEVYNAIFKSLKEHLFAQ